MKKFLTCISTLAIILIVASPFTCTVASAKTRDSVVTPTTMSGTSSTTIPRHSKSTIKLRSKTKHSRTLIKPITVSRGKAYISAKRIADAATTTTNPKVVKAEKTGEKVKIAPRLKKRKPFNLGIDLKPYLAIITLLFIAVKTGYARVSLSPLRYTNLL